MPHSRREATLVPSDSEPVWEDPRRVLARHGLRPQRRWSQNFLVARSVADAIAAAATAVPAACIVELGSGLGTLTAALLRAGATDLVASDHDPAMLEVLRAEFGKRPNVRVVPADATSCDFAAFCAEAPATGSGVSVARSCPTIVGNLPYAQSGAILRHLVNQRHNLACCVLMLQREVVERLLAAPGTRAYGALTVFATRVYSARRLLRVPAGAFFPMPKVDSCVVELRPLVEPRAPDTAKFERVVRAVFQQRRKTLRNALRAVGTQEEVERMLALAGIDGGRRGEELSIEDFGQLSRGDG